MTARAVARLRQGLAGLVLTLAAAVPAVAQDVPIPEKLLALAPGTRIRVTLTDGTRHSGLLDQVGSGRLGISVPGRGVESIPAGRLRLVERQGNHAKTGLIAGGITGVLFGAFVGTVVRAACDAAECDGVRPYAVAVPLFGGAGALLGTGLGALFPRWRRVAP